MSKQLSIQEIDQKIAFFEGSLTKTFVPEDEKALCRDSIQRLKALKSSMTGNQSTSSPVATAGMFPNTDPLATPIKLDPMVSGGQVQQDTETNPQDNKKKNLYLLALRKVLFLINRFQHMLK